ncbi:MAG: phosphatidylglycerophosphatase A [Alphaproteobacteria bacterium]
MSRLDLPWNLPFTHPISLIVTWFGAGLMPRMPGTWGAAAALPCAWVIVEQFGLVGLWIATVLAFFLGWWACFVVLSQVKDGASHDPGLVVIDEVAGQWMVLLAVPLNPTAYLLAFVLFRLFDIWKPWPIRHLESALPPAFAIMADDVVAGLYASLGFLAISIGLHYV